jgi:hypothetical protein
MRQLRCNTRGVPPHERERRWDTVVDGRRQGKKKMSLETTDVDHNSRPERGLSRKRLRMTHTQNCTSSRVCVDSEGMAATNGIHQVYIRIVRTTTLYNNSTNEAGMDGTHALAYVTQNTNDETWQEERQGRAVERPTNIESRTHYGVGRPSSRCNRSMRRPLHDARVAWFMCWWEKGSQETAPKHKNEVSVAQTGELVAQSHAG